MKKFGHKRPVRGDDGEIVGHKPSPVWRKTVSDSLGFNHGPDKGRNLAVGLLDGDVIAVRPAGTRREPLTITPSDLYTYLVRLQANKETLAKAREKKERKAARLARARQERAEKRLVRPL